MTNHIPLGGNSIVVGATRTGKTSFIIESLKRFEPSGSLVVFDRQGEYCQALAGDRSQHARLLDLRSVGMPDILPLSGSPDCVNPLDLVRRDENLVSDIHDIVVPMVQSTAKSDSYWDDKSVELLSGVIGYVLGARKDSDRVPNLGDIYDLLSQPIEAFEHLAKEMIKSPDICFGLGAKAAATFLSADGRERSSIHATAARALGFLAIPQIRAALSKSTFDVEEILNGQSDLFAVVPPSLRFAPAIVGLITSVVAARASALNPVRYESGPAVTIVFDKIDSNRGLDAVLREFRHGGPQVSIIASGHTFMDFVEVFGADASRDIVENASRVYFNSRLPHSLPLHEDVERLRQMTSGEFLPYD